MEREERVLRPPPEEEPPPPPPPPPPPETPTPEVCSSDIRKNEKNKIINSYGNQWVAVMRSERDGIFRAIPREYQQSATVSPFGNPFINVSIDKKSCQRATVFVTQVWTVQFIALIETRIPIDNPNPAAGERQQYEIRRSAVRRSNMVTRAQNFRCEKSGEAWICR